MKRILAAFVILTFVTITACHSQQPPTTPVYSCPAAPANGTAYTPLNSPANDTTAASITGTNYTDQPTTGTWCYIVQSWAIVNGAPTYQDSVPSNVAGPFTTTTTLAGVALSWTAPVPPSGTIYTSVGYIVSRSAAVLSPAPLAPVLSQPTGVAQLEKQQIYLAAKLEKIEKLR